MKVSFCDVCDMPIKGTVKPTPPTTQDGFARLFGFPQPTPPGDEWKNQGKQAHTNHHQPQFHTNLELCEVCQKSMNEVFIKWISWRREYVRKLNEKLKDKE